MKDTYTSLSCSQNLRCHIKLVNAMKWSGSCRENYRSLKLSSIAVILASHILASPLNFTQHLLGCHLNQHLLISITKRNRKSIYKRLRFSPNQISKPSNISNFL